MSTIICPKMTVNCHLLSIVLILIDNDYMTTVLKYTFIRWTKYVSFAQMHFDLYFMIRTTVKNQKQHWTFASATFRRIVITRTEAAANIGQVGACIVTPNVDGRRPKICHNN